MSNQFTMRTALVDELLKLDNKDTYFLTADVGYGVLEPLQKKMKKRFMNVGLAEQSMIGIASGIALSGKKVYTYTMCSFYLRALEQIKLDLCYQGANVVMIGVGTQFDYQHLGTTHFGIDDGQVIGQLLNIQVFTPKNQKALRELLRRDFDTPVYIRIGGFQENDDIETDEDLLNKYPKEGGSKQYFQDRFREVAINIQNPPANPSQPSASVNLG